MYATVRNPSCRIHGGAIIAGVNAVVNGEKTGDGGIPKNIVTDGPVVTKANADGMLWMEESVPDLNDVRVMAPLVELTDIVKTFGGVQALRGVDFALRPGIDPRRSPARTAPARAR